MINTKHCMLWSLLKKGILTSQNFGWGGGLSY